MFTLIDTFMSCNIYPIRNENTVCSTLFAGIHTKDDVTLWQYNQKIYGEDFESINDRFALVLNKDKILYSITLLDDHGNTE